jgi:hypothetical protein
MKGPNPEMLAAIKRLATAVGLSEEFAMGNAAATLERAADVIERMRSSIDTCSGSCRRDDLAERPDGKWSPNCPHPRDKIVRGSGTTDRCTQCWAHIAWADSLPPVRILPGDGRWLHFPNEGDR